MSEDLQHIDDLFRSGIEGKEEIPAPATWENIEKELDKKDSRPGFFYWWNARRIAAAFIILATSAGLFAGGYYLGINKENKVRSGENKGSHSPVPNSASSDQKVVDQLFDNNSAASHKPEDQPNPELLQEGTSDAANAGSIAGVKQRITDQVENNSGEKAAESSNKSGMLIAPESKAGTYQAAAGISKNSSVELQAGLQSSKASGVKNNGNKPQVSSEKEKPAVASENYHVDVIGQPEEPSHAIPAARTREAEMITAGSLSRSLPETQKQIPANKPTPVTVKPVSSGLTTQDAAQKSIPVLNKRSSSVDLPRFSFTPVAGLQFGSNRIVATNDPHAQYVKTDIDRTESQPLSISGGILADLRIARNMTLQSGIMYTSRTIEIEPKYIKAERNPDGKVRYKFDCSAGTYYIKKSTYARPGDSAMTIFSTNELNYINIPLALTYHFGGKKFSFFATAGAGLNLLTDQYLETGLSNYNYDEKESVATNLKSRYFNGMLGAGLNYRPFKKVSFLFSPQYQFAVSPMNENMPVKAYPRIFNMQLGMQIRL